MKKVILLIRILGIVIIIFLLFRGKEIDYVKLGLYKTNPCSYVYNVSINELISVLDSCKKDFAKELDYDSHYYRTSNPYLRDIIIKDYPRLRALLEPENRNDFLLLHYFGFPKTYLPENGWISYHAIFHIHLDSLEVNKSKVTINTISPEVDIQVNWIISHAPGFFNSYDLKEGSSIEEYIILRTIGRKLKLDDTMPSIIFPNKVLGYNVI